MDIKETQRMARNKVPKGLEGRRTQSIEDPGKRQYFFWKQEEEVIVFYLKFLNGSFCLLSICCSQDLSFVVRAMREHGIGAGSLDVCAAAMPSRRKNLTWNEQK